MNEQINPSPIEDGDNQNITQNNQNTDDTPPKQEFSIWGELYDWAEALVFSLVVLILIFTFAFRIITVDGESMLQTLHPQDKLIIRTVEYQPKYGDIVVVNMPNWSNQPFIKRVIATGGQTVDINYQKGTVIVDGEELDEPYINDIIRKKSYDELDFPLTVPEHFVFVMGDNRNHSTDSRSGMVGIIDDRYVMGEAVFQIYPFNQIGTMGGIEGWT